MKKVLAAALLATAANAADAPLKYAEGWSYVSFANEVALCRSSILSSAAQGHLTKGNAAGRPAEDLRSEVISLLPALDRPASAGCFCVINEIAKLQPYVNYFGTGDSTARLTAMAAGLQKSPCAEQLQSSMDVFKDKPAVEAMRLR